jgi:hypothetical protein
LLVHCSFHGHTRNCSKIFAAVMTDEGECCAFNVMPEFLMYKPETIEVGDL